MPLFHFEPGANLDQEIQNVINAVKAEGVTIDDKLSLIAAHKAGIGRTGATSNGCGPAATVDPSNNPAIIWNFLANKGLTAVQIAGIMGNLQSESGGTWDPEIVQYGFMSACGQISQAGQPSSKCPTHEVNGQVGYGLVQWTTRGRQQALLDIAQRMGSIGDHDNNPGTPDVIISGILDIQMEFMWEELSTTFNNSVLVPLQAETDLRQATHIILWSFECPRTCVDAKERPNEVKPGDGRTYQEIYDEHLDSRTRNSQSLLTQFGSI